MKTWYFMMGLVAIFVVFQSFISVNASKTERQKYRLVSKTKKFEIRYYPSATFATIFSDATNYKGVASKGFRKLAGYIFGGNEKKESISMTAPVRMSMSDKGSSMSFIMPEKYSDQNLPIPNDKSISIQNSNPEYVAVISFGGYASDEKITIYKDKLMEALAKEKIQVKGSFSFLGYNAPFQFVGRTNEIIIPIEWKE